MSSLNGTKGSVTAADTAIEPVDTTEVLQVSGIYKSFPGVMALRGVTFGVRPAEIHGLVGHNGAGKSTLVRIVSGIYRPDHGTVCFDGHVRQLRGPQDAQRLGIFTIHQELSLVPNLSVAENILISDLPKRGGGLVSWRRVLAEARRALDLVGSDVNASMPVSRLSVGQQQTVELAKALRREARVVLLDEPSAALSAREVDQLFAVLRRLRERGLGLVYISHRLDEIIELCDRVTVMRNGQRVSTLHRQQVSRGAIVEAMLGKELAGSVLARATGGEGSKLHSRRAGGIVLRVAGLSDGSAVHGVSLDLRAGEAIGITGLIGNGQVELAHLLGGSRARSGGTVVVEERPLRLRSPREAIRSGIGFLPEDRKTQGLVLGMDVVSNVTLASRGRFARWGVLRRSAETREVERILTGLRMRKEDVGRTVRDLSGGTQQKVVLAKWLATQCRILVFAEPTRGVDVGAKEEVYEIIGTFVDNGGAVILVTSEIEESMLCDRVLVMARGKIVGQVVSRGEPSDYEAVKALCT